MASSSATSVTVFDLRQHYGNILYQRLVADIAVIETDLKAANMWNPLFTPAKVVGMIMAADYTVEELYYILTNPDACATLVLDALDALNEQAPPGSPDPTARGRHPAQKLAVVHTLGGEATKAVLTMRPLFV
jgi:hypothetical protein